MLDKCTENVSFREQSSISLKTNTFNSSIYEKTKRNCVFYRTFMRVILKNHLAWNWTKCIKKIEEIKRSQNPGIIDVKQLLEPLSWLQQPLIIIFKRKIDFRNR